MDDKEDLACEYLYLATEKKEKKISLLLVTFTDQMDELEEPLKHNYIEIVDERLLEDRKHCEEKF